jgi:hypothetical protein
LEKQTFAVSLVDHNSVYLSRLWRFRLTCKVLSVTVAAQALT